MTNNNALINRENPTDPGARRGLGPHLRADRRLR